MLVRQMRASAQAEDLPTTVLSFFPHPSVVLHGWKPAFYLSSPEEKANRLGELGVDYVINQRFDLDLSHLRAAAFLDWIEDRLHPKGLWVGPDFALGYRREGDIAYLETASRARGFHLHVVEPARVGGEVVSSTRIRKALWAGDMAVVNRLLAAPFSLPVDGDGFHPSSQDQNVLMASQQVSRERACPSTGLYAGRVETEGGGTRALAHVVHAPESQADSRPSEIDIYLPAGSQWKAADARLAFLKRLSSAAVAPLPAAELAQHLQAIADLS
jgi:riboflavin kinase/FMN adenylyltransferase